MDTLIRELFDDKQADTLAKLDIHTVRDLLYHMPRSYVELGNIIPSNAVADGSEVTLMGTVVNIEHKKSKPHLTLTELTIDDNGHQFKACWFNQKYVANFMPVDSLVLVHGKASIYYDRLRLNVSEYENITHLNQADIPRILPLYPLTAGLAQRNIRQMIKHILIEYGDKIEESIPENIIKKYKLPSRYQSLRMIHAPMNMLEKEIAKQRIAFEELFHFQLLLAARKHSFTWRHKAHTYQNDGRLIKQFADSLEYKLTAGQRRTWSEILSDMNSDRPMCRLLQGDVGCGKTTVCELAALKTTEAGLQTAVMAPTEILALQHYKEFKERLSPLGIKIGLYVSNRKSNLMENDITVGTHALAQENVTFKNLGLVVIDEQHRFGVDQRKALLAKGTSPDLLAMTATPIPRTLGMVLYGDMDISIIDTMPVGRLPVITRRYCNQRLQDMWVAVKRQLDQGRQAYFVCAMVEESEHAEQQAATELFERLQHEFNGYRIGLLHGRMKTAEKDQVMDQFTAGETHVLISTSVIEVGVNVPNATVMIVIDADRFGLAQLHQLRGRVGRGEHQSYCLLVADPKTPEGNARLDAMVRTTNGFELAEEDLKLRGHGEFFGTRQSGVSDFKVANLAQHHKILQAAREDAFRIIDTDPMLILPEHGMLVRRLEEKSKQLEQVSV